MIAKGEKAEKQKNAYWTRKTFECYEMASCFYSKKIFI